MPAFRRTPHVRYTVKRGPPCFPSAPMVSLRRQRLGADPVEAFVRIVAGGQSRHTGVQAAGLACPSCRRNPRSRWEWARCSTISRWFMSLAPKKLS